MPRANGTTTQRGYGAEHQRLRRQWAARIAKGGVSCSRCGTLLQPGMPFDLDHADDRRSYRGPSCPACNRAAPRMRMAALRRRPVERHPGLTGMCGLTNPRGWA